MSSVALPSPAEIDQVLASRYGYIIILQLAEISIYYIHIIYSHDACFIQHPFKT